LHQAVSRNYDRVVEILLEANADVDKRNATGKTAIQLARDKGYNVVVEILERWMEDNRIHEAS